MKYYSIITLISICVLSGCSHGQSGNHAALLQVENIINEDPNKAMQMLYEMENAQNKPGEDGDKSDIEHSRLDTKEDSALFGLLYIAAIHKIGLEIRNDSLITNSVDYYRQQKDHTRLAKALLHLGITHQSNGRWKDAVTCLKEAEEDLNDLNLSLHQLDASIEGHIDELTTGKTPEEILTFFEKYEERIVVGAYQRFKTNDNLFYYRTGLHEKLDYCEEQFFDVLVRDYAETEHTGEAESRLEIQRLLRSMKDALEEMEDMMRVIDEHHILYRTRAVQRAQFLLLSDGTTKSRIAGLLKYYTADIQDRDDLGAWDDTVVRDVFQVFGQSYFDFSSLAAPVKRRKPTPITEMEDAEELDPEFIGAQNRVLMEYARNALTSDNVNRYAEEILKGRPNATAALVMKQDPSAIIKVIGLYTYSTSPERTYNVRLRNSYVTVGGVRFRDFVIERK